MTETPGSNVQEEPQSERGPVGSRDTGSDEPAGGPVDRPVGTADAEHDTSIKPEGPQHPGAPNLPSGH